MDIAGNLQRNCWDSGHRGSTWINPYWRIQASILDLTNAPYDDSTKGNDKKTSEKEFIANIKIVPRHMGTSSFRVIFDINPYFDPSLKITYQAIRPNDSEIFKIVTSGQLQKLLWALENVTASLTDRDEEGRSLLHVSCLWLTHVPNIKYKVVRNERSSG